MFHIRRFRMFGQAAGYSAFVALSLLPLYFYSKSDRVPHSEKALSEALVGAALGHFLGSDM